MFLVKGYENLSAKPSVKGKGKAILFIHGLCLKLEACGAVYMKQILNKHNMIKNPNWQEADQLAIYKHDRGL